MSTTTTQSRMHSRSNSLSKMTNSFLALVTVLPLCNILLLLPTTGAFQQVAYHTGSVQRQQPVSSSSLNYAGSATFPQPSPSSGAAGGSPTPSLHDLLSKTTTTATTVPTWAAAAKRVIEEQPGDLTYVIREVNTLEDYKKMMQDNALRAQQQQQANNASPPLTVVRFHATYCAACKRAAPSFHRLVRKHVPSASSSSSSISKSLIQFVDVAVSKNNVDLQRHVGLKSIPSAFLYHPKAGLVEQLSINKSKLHRFEETLETYLEGKCPVTYTADGDVR
jgi:thiol-disulfide isomerase/thioredoxin